MRKHEPMFLTIGLFACQILGIIGGIWRLQTSKTLNFQQFEKQLAQNKNPAILDGVK
jgi:uncharacterized membrane protein YqjE